MSDTTNKRYCERHANFDALQCNLQKMAGKHVWLCPRCRKPTRELREGDPLKHPDYRCPCCGDYVIEEVNR